MLTVSGELSLHLVLRYKNAEELLRQPVQWGGSLMLTISYYNKMLYTASSEKYSFARILIIVNSIINVNIKSDIIIIKLYKN